MALATYSDLKTAVATWLSRTDQTSNIPDFITLAHDKLMRTLRTREMETIDAALSISAETVSVPSLWLETRSIYITSTSPRYQLQFKTPEQLIEGNSAADSGIPKYFSVISGKFQFSPLPDITYTATHIYYSSLAQMSAGTDHNWILDSHPDLYLYGALLESVALIQDDPRIGLWQSRYDRALTEVNRNSALAKASGAMQVRPA